MNRLINGFWWLVEVVAAWCLRLLFRMLRKELKSETEKNFLQFVRFVVVGVSNTIVSYVILTVSRLAIERTGFFVDYAYILANGIAFVLGVAWAFYWNDRYVFTVAEGEKRSMFKALIKTYISYSFTGLFLSSVLLVLWIEVFGMSKFVAPLLNSIIGVPINFFINKFWSFRKEER